MALREKLEQCQQIRAELVTARAVLNQDIRVKGISLDIDGGKCLPVRIKFPHNNKFVKNSAIIANYSLSRPGAYNKCKPSCEMEWCLALAEYIQTHLAQVKQLTDR